jgi:hypothetical protein
VYALITMAALALVPHELTLLDTADVIELNHFYDPEGRKVFDQVIFWEWHAEEAAFRIVAWRLWKSPAQTPERDWQRGGYRTLWFDEDQLRLVRATSYRETWTQYDPELEDRQFLVPNRRRGLASEPKLSVPFGPPSGH